MVGRAIISHYPRAVNAQNYRQLRYRHVVDDIVVGALQERRIDIAEHHRALFRHSRRECNRMLLRYPHVEHPVGVHFLHDTHRATRWHRRRNAHYPLVFPRHRQQLLAEHLLPQRRHIALLPLRSLALARLYAELPGCMPCRLVLLRRRVALAFLRDDMQHFRTLVVLYLAQNTHQVHHVMPVCRTEIADVHRLEDVVRLLGENALQVVMPPHHLLPLRLVHQV